ncbi:MAG: DoxX family protein, partial [Deltaproteobacteria bacterium]|nr:DoxX family protein [Deltaproteobacteria bacterium]
RWGVLALLIFLVPTTLIFHAFWAVPPEMQQMQMINFMKNLAIGGALLLTFVHGAGPLSIDARQLRVHSAGA